MVLGAKSSTHFMFVTNLSLGWVIFIKPAMPKASATKICTIQSAVFILHILRELCVYKSPSLVA
jgi:hypothetical protein